MLFAIRDKGCFTFEALLFIEDHKFPEIGFVNTKVFSIIVFSECQGEFDLLSFIPFELIPVKCTIHFFNVINLLLLSGSPEIVIPRDIIADLFQSFTDQKVFPQNSYILSDREGLKLSYHGITYPVVIEVDFVFCFYFVSQISA